MHGYNVEEVTDLPGVSEDDEQPFSTGHLQNNVIIYEQLSW